MTTHAARMVRANGIQLCTDSFGNAKDPALVLVMGLGAQMIAWHDPFCASLAAKGFHVIRFDNRDIGLSTKFPEAGIPNIMAIMGTRAIGGEITAPYALKDMAADTVGLLDAYGIAKAHIVGASMGGMIAQEMAMHFGSRMRSMTSIMSSTGNSKLPQATPEAAAVLMTPSPMDREGYCAHFIKVQRILRGPHFPEENASDPDRATLTFERGINPAGVARQLAAVFKSGDRTAALKAVTTPTLVLHGDADPLVRVEAGKATAAAIPGARLGIVKNMGHSFPKALWPELIDAIADHAKAH